MQKVFLAALVLFSFSAAALQQGNIPGNYLLEKKEILAINSSNLTVEDFTENSVALYAVSSSGVLLPHFTIVQKNGFVDTPLFTVRYGGVFDEKAAISLMQQGGRNASNSSFNGSEATASPTPGKVKATAPLASATPTATDWIDFVPDENYSVAAVAQGNADNVVVTVKKDEKKVRKAPLNVTGPDGSQQYETGTDGTASFPARKAGRYFVQVVGASGSAEYEKTGGRNDWLYLLAGVVALIVLLYCAKNVWESEQMQEIREKAGEFKEEAEEKLGELKNKLE